MNKCHTAARKYFLLALFQIPTEDDADADGGQQQQDRLEQVPQTPPDRRKISERATVARPMDTSIVPAQPSRIAPVRGETPKTWAAKYGTAIANSRTLEDIEVASHQQRSSPTA
jgi:hypothetical protein